ncbi:hypothetical protein, partial [Clostridium tarantellae]|uniref:hypothetical protein n=1 Tax=Clostridium tarantellae TaxID=39493 RepID=UPI001478A2AB
DFTSNKDILEKVINNICDKKLENCKVSTLNLENQLNKMNKNTDKYVIFLTDSSIKENLNTEDNYENLINKYKNVNFMVINLNSKLKDNEEKNLIISSFNSNNKDKIFQVKNNEELKQNCEKIENSILKGNRCYKNIVI